jgi:hypothetical protein
MQELQESSTNFDMEHVRPFLQRISTLIEYWLWRGAKFSRSASLPRAWSATLSRDLEFRIRYAGRDSLLCIGIFMDDINAPDVYFFPPPALAAQIDVEMEMFFDEMGM